MVEGYGAYIMAPEQGASKRLIHRSAWKENSPKPISSMLHSPASLRADKWPILHPAPSFKAQDIGAVNEDSPRRDASEAVLAKKPFAKCESE